MYFDLLEQFREEGHQVYVCMPLERRFKGETGLRQQFGMHFLKIRTLNIQKTSYIEKGLASVLLEFQYLRSIDRYLSDVAFDLVLYSTPPITFTRIVERLKRRNHVRSYLLLKDIFPQNAVDLEIISKSGIFYKYFRKKEKRLYEVSDFIGCMTAANRDYILEHNPEIDPRKIEINANSVKLVDLPVDSVPADVRFKYQLPQDKLIFIYGGNLGKPQGVDFIIEVLKSNRNNAQIFFLIIGDGTEYERLENAVDELAISNVRLLSKMHKDDYDQVVSGCDIGLIFLDHRFTIPNFPSRLLTYLEYELPVLAATDEATDLKDVIEANRIGCWCRSGDIAAFNQYVERLIRDPEELRRMGKRGKELLVREYDVKNSYQLIAGKLN